VGLIKLALNLTYLLSNIIHIYDSHPFLPHKLLHCPLPSPGARLLVCSGTELALFGLIIRRRVMTMIYRSHRGVESLHNGTLEHTGHHGKAQYCKLEGIMLANLSILQIG
jgi:hypothetical protein